MGTKKDEAFTMVFAGDIRKFKNNPFTTETPWGIPYAVSVGDASGLKEHSTRPVGR